MIQSKTYPSLNLIRLSTAIVSLLFSSAVYFSDLIINSDGILYIQTIEAYKATGLSAVGDLYNWPFFTIFSAWFSEFTGWSSSFSVKAVNAILFVMLTDALVLLSQQTLPNRRQVAIAAILILGFYTLNEYREFIIRDVGYWALACYAFYYFIRFLDTSKWHHAISWQALMCLALLFRIEAIVFISLLPLYIFFSQRVLNKKKALLQLYSVSAAILLMTLIFILATPETTAAFSKIYELLIYADPSQLFSKLQSETQLLKREVLHPAADDHAANVLVLGLVATVAWEFIVGISVPYIILTAMALISLKRFSGSPEMPFFAYVVALNLLLLTVFSIHSFLITTRYCVLGLIILFLLLTPTLTRYIDQQMQNRRFIVCGGIAFLLIVSVADTMITTKAKPHVREVPLWAAENLPSDARIVTDEMTLAYYFNKQREGSKIKVIDNFRNNRRFDYIIVYLESGATYKNPQLEHLALELIKYEGNQDNRVAVYRVNHDLHTDN